MAEWLTKAERENYGLPTEAEWEYACRAGTTTLHYGGDDLAWLRTNANVAQMHKGTTPVGQFAANSWGLHDMLGNCWQWVADWYAPYVAGAVVDPKGPDAGKERVIRGGAWNGSQPTWVRPSFRYSDKPTTRSYGIGFRCAKTL